MSFSATLPGRAREVPALHRYSRSQLDGVGSQWVSAGLVMLILLVPITLSTIADLPSQLLCSGAAFATTTLFAVASIKLGNQRDLSGFIVVPLLISAIQNVYLGLLAPHMLSLFVQLALLTHFVFSIVLLIAYYFARERAPTHPLLPQLLFAALGIVLFAAVSVLAMKTSMVAMVSSARNMLSPFLFLMVGLVFAERVRLQTFLTLVALLTWTTIVFGFVEYFGSRTVWQALNIDTLWIKKGIPNLAAWGMPANFVSSERFFGEQIRRMVSSYADPVNFGTVLYLFFLVAWFTRRRLLLVMCLLAIALCISKGAMLGLLLFVIVLTWHTGNRALFAAGALLAVVLGGGVVAYTMTHSTQSLATHVGGLVAAIITLPEHPFGRGLGGVGVLAEGDSGELRESGLGLIIGQMGVLAFITFGALFYGLWRWVLRITDRRERIFAQSAYLGIFFNIAFNEVALSPNSSAGYFLLLGLLVSGDWLRRSAGPPAGTAVFAQ